MRKWIQFNGNWISTSHIIAFHKIITGIEILCADYSFNAHYQNDAERDDVYDDLFKALIDD